MSKRKAFLLRIDPKLYKALQQWADHELRSLNGQIEYVLRNAVRSAGRDLTRSKKEGGPG